GAASLAGAVVLVAACGGGGGAGGAGATSPTTATAQTTTTTATASTQSNADYVQCLRDHGVTLPSTPPSSDTGTPPSSFDRSGFQQARQACGPPPSGFGFGGGGGGQVDPQAAQQAALQLAACLRAQGLNVPDPDFSTTTTSPPTTATGASGSGGGGFR